MKVLGLRSVYVTVPSVPANVSLTTTLPSTMVVGAPLKLAPAIPVAVPSGVWKVVLFQVAVPVLVPLNGLGAFAYEQL